MPGAAVVSGDRLTLRTVESADGAFVHAHWNRPAIRHATNRYEPRSEADVEAFLDDADESAVHFLPCRDGEPVGFVWLFEVAPVAGRGEVGYWIVDGERGNGYATEALDLLLGYAFDTLRLHKVVARVFAWNDASMRVLENAGFEREGVLVDEYYVDGAFVDAVRFGRLADR